MQGKKWPRTFLGTRGAIFAPGISHSRFFLTLFLSLHSKAKVKEYLLIVYNYYNDNFKP